jgi:uncharacterized damage-inducible protein DinB
MMRVMDSHLRYLFELNRWANRLILDASAGLTHEQLDASVPGTYGSIGRTLAHLVTAEDSYAARFSDRPRILRWDEETQPPSLAVIRDCAELVGPELVTLATTVADGLVLDTTRMGRPTRLPAATVLAQVIDHGREHRTHIATILTQLGIQPPDMDAWAFEDARAGA